MILWAIINCGVPLLAVAVAAGVLYIWDKRLTVAELFKDGQLYFINVAISMTTLYDVIKASSPATKEQELWCVFLILILLLFSLGMYGLTATALITGPIRVAQSPTPSAGNPPTPSGPNGEKLAGLSLWAYGITVVLVLVIRFQLGLDK